MTDDVLDVTAIGRPPRHRGGRRVAGGSARSTTWADLAEATCRRSSTASAPRRSRSAAGRSRPARRSSATSATPRPRPTASRTSSPWTRQVELASRSSGRIVPVRSLHHRQSADGSPHGRAGDRPVRAGPASGGRGPIGLREARVPGLPRDLDRDGCGNRRARMPTGRIARARIAVGACSEVAQRLPELEAELVGQEGAPGTARVAEVREHLAALNPIDDVRGSAAYRREAALELVRRALARVLAMTADVVARGSIAVELTVNGTTRRVDVDPMRRLSDVLRDDLGLTGTKVGCEAGDCGACTIRLNGRQAVSCCVPAAQAEGADLTTVEGLANDGRLAQRPPGRVPGARRGAVRDLHAGDARWRPTGCSAQPRTPTSRRSSTASAASSAAAPGYTKIVEAIAATRDARLANGHANATWEAAAGAGAPARPPVPPSGRGFPRSTGCPGSSARRATGPTTGPTTSSRCAPSGRRTRERDSRSAISAAFRASHPGIVDILTAADVPGQNRYGIYPTGKDQPALADGVVRHRGEAVLALVGDERTLASIDDRELPITWHAEEPLRTIQQALADGAPRLHEHAEDNVLIRGRLATGDVDAGARRLGRHVGRRGRDDPRRARLHRARGRRGAPRRRSDRGHRQHPGAVHGSRRGRPDPRHPADERPDHPDGLRRRLRRQARPRASIR